MKTLLICIVISALTLHAQPAAPNSQNEGAWEGYDGELNHVFGQLMALAEAIPAEKYSWRPGPGVRSVSEVLAHIAQTNFYLLGVAGAKMPPDVAKDDRKETVESKATVIAELKRSLDAVRTARIQLKPGDLERKVTVNGKVVPVEAVYLRLLVHNNEHMGQLVAYARMNAIVPPWSRSIVNK